ncbi:MAG: serine hydroxymethyltransferase [Patescibacteria group bacterium]|nr:serine hydroxymethyltransferase [Patescibacteria group bacterium]
MTDPIFDLISQEEKRQKETLMMIPSENYTYPEVRKAVGSVLMHKYAEGYPGKRYYQGNRIIDQIENLAIERAKKLFNVPHANVQPYSGSPANAAVYFGLLEPGETIMGLALAHGGHLTHGHPKVTFAGKYFRSVQYEIEVPRVPRGDGGTNCFDFEKIREMALENKPKIIVVGTTSFPRTLPWKEFSQIAEEVGAYLLADISHIVGLVVGGVHPSPVPYADVIMSTTQKSLRGPRGALLMVTDKGLKKDSEMAKKIDKAVFPGLQGGPHMHSIAGIAITLEKASQPEFKEYAGQVVKNAKVLSRTLVENGFELVTGGTDNHLMVIDLRNSGVNGKEAAEKLEEEGIVTNKNAVPNDLNPPSVTSGVRIGTPALTTRGMKEEEMKEIGEMFKEVLIEKKSVINKVKELCQRFPVP